MEDLGETALSFGQVKAAATGDPLLLEQAEQHMAITRLQRLQNAHHRARYRNRQEAAWTRKEAQMLSQRITTLHKLCEMEATCTHKGLVPFRGETLEDASRTGNYLAKEIDRVVKRGPDQEWIGHFSGVVLRILVEPDRRSRQGRVDVLLALGENRADGGMVLKRCKIPQIAQQDGPSCQGLPGSANSLVMRVEDLDKAMIHGLE